VPDQTADIERKTGKTVLSGERADVDRSFKMDEIVVRTGASSPSAQDHYHSVLASMVSSVTQDHAQLRTLIYEFARRKLRKDLFRQFEDGEWSEIEKQVSTLEAAINQIEADFLNNDLPRLPSSAGKETNNGRSVVSSSAADSLPPLSQKKFMLGSFGGSTAYEYDRRPPIVNVTDYTAKTRVERHLQSNFWRAVELVIAVTLGVAIYSAIDRQTTLSIYNTARYGRSANNVASAIQDLPPGSRIKDETGFETAPPSRPGISGIPLPASYGVYALSDGKLTTLDQLPIKPPDSRIAISAAINTPSQAHLQPGPLQFVVFRRDFANDAPDRVSVRVVAQVMRALTFDASGKAAYIKVEPTWVIRSQTFQMSVAPVANNFEMVVIKPDSADFSFAPGRYALVLKKDAYDFTVDGPISDGPHCLERTDALGGAVYSECPKPQTNSPAPAAKGSENKKS
jgi:hypothetical protein